MKSNQTSMDEFGNWVYIILMAVVVISSVIKSINKKKEQQQPQPQIPVPEPMEQSFPVPPATIKKSRQMPPPAPKQKNQPYSSLFASQTIAESLQTELALTSQQESALADELDLTDTEAFRKAIIYSEIVNRKY
jgi:hypothetical protein